MVKIGIVVRADGEVAVVKSNDPTVEVLVVPVAAMVAAKGGLKRALQRDYKAILDLQHEVWE